MRLAIGWDTPNSVLTYAYFVMIKPRGRKVHALHAEPGQPITVEAVQYHLIEHGIDIEQCIITVPHYRGPLKLRLV